MNLTKRFYLPLFLGLLLGLPASHAKPIPDIETLIDQAANFKSLKPESKQREASIFVARALLINHYRKQDIDQGLSSKVFDNYLDSLDSQRLYFLESDIDDFEKYRYRLQGALKTGQLEPGFIIYNRYQQRLIDRLVYSLAFLDSDFNKIRFDVEESILTDRSEAPRPNSENEQKDVWRKRIKSAALSTVLSGKTLGEAKETLSKRYQNQLSRVLQARSEDAFQAYMNAFTTIYDPHTTYFSPRSSENFNINMSLSLEGIGAVLQSDNEFTKVVRLVTGGPAASQSKLGPADRIVGVAQGGDGEMVDVIGWRLDEVVELIRGPKSSTVRLEIIPADAKVDTDTVEMSIVRDKVKLEDQAANSEVIEVKRDGKDHKIGIIDIPTFYQDWQGMQNGDPNYKSTTRDVRNLLNKLISEDQINGLVIDLRGNGGGSLGESNQLTGLFIDSGPTVQIRSSDNRVDTLRDPDPSLVYGGPLVVLVDRLSASASEIFAGAIQDYGRGIVVGSQTFGKGTVQSVRRLNHGQLKITNAKFYRISGASTQHKGVIPDIMIPETVDKSKVGEDALDHALPWDSIRAAKYQHASAMDQAIAMLAGKHESRFTQNPEYKLLMEEIDLLQSQRNKSEVSLKKATRQAEDEAVEMAQLAIVNKRRKLDSLEPFKDVEAWEDFLDKEEAENSQDLDIDFIAEEGAEIIVDLIEIQTRASDEKAA